MQELFCNTLNWIQNLGLLGGLAFIIIYTLAAILFIPGSLLTLGAGVVFDVVLGSIYVFIGATLGSIGSFLVGRYLARNWVAKKIENNEKFKAIDKAIAQSGFKIVLLTRLSPVFPFNLLNYALGITRVRLKDYALGSIGMIPGTIMYVYIGSLAGNIAQVCSGNQVKNPQAETAQWIIRIIGFIATVAVTLYVTKIAKKALEEST
ncbi:TVP38/TMEM64 family protein [Merismopedia glauca]|uniref:TVP38/TMEM64 family membrane protein n=1 Tax=Merismopedia glauca CCAP 1448/3 TaxID=1296344 RepID=A0A2T1BWR3_9CYAN|nr:TVP38/TMEM64 family protein [Merismopedia glauca]PSB00459.1 hypothetical protein C7B64_23390 [Merismopedia glauca CCAP 1448/3]